MGFIRRLATGHRCRNTQLRIGTEKRQGCQAQVVVEMVDKCSGFVYEATYSPETADRIVAEIQRHADLIRCLAIEDLGEVRGGDHEAR